MRRSLSLAAPAIAALLIAAGSATALSAQAARNVARPSGWRVVMDRQSSDTVAHEAMPPGWHMTTGPGALLFDPAYHAVGRYSVAGRLFLFPGTSQSGYGSLFAAVTPWMARRRATWCSSSGVTVSLAGVRRRGQPHRPIPWKTSPAVKRTREARRPCSTLSPSPSIGDPIRPGERPASWRSGARGVDLDGTSSAFRADPTRLHTSRLDLRTRFAPVPEPKKK